jgi:hypothetical protein
MKLRRAARKVSDLDYPAAYLFEKRADGWYWNLKELAGQSDQWTGPFVSKRSAIKDCGGKE